MLESRGKLEPVQGQTCAGACLRCDLSNKNFTAKVAAVHCFTVYFSMKIDVYNTMYICLSTLLNFTILFIKIKIKNMTRRRISPDLFQVSGLSQHNI